eukprot:121857-Chlamydomonas_euryale.AAC.1
MEVQLQMQSVCATLVVLVLACHREQVGRPQHLVCLRLVTGLQRLARLRSVMGVQQLERLHPVMEVQQLVRLRLAMPPGSWYTSTRSGGSAAAGAHSPGHGPAAAGAPLAGNASAAAGAPLPSCQAAMHGQALLSKDVQGL